jgi:hypothetical protein
MPSLATVALALPSTDQPDPAPAHLPALRYFDASTIEEAIPAARALHAASAECPRCRNLLAHRFDRIGSTLFHDDDPRELVRAFAWTDRDGCSVRLLAACIVLFGRERESLR